MTEASQPPVFSARELEKVFGEGDSTVHALRAVSMMVRAGEFVAIMGPSGSGKSTLLHILGGMDSPTQGELHFQGRNLARLDDNALAEFRRHVGFVFQAFNLLPNLTACQNVAMPLLLDGMAYGRACRKARTALEELGLGNHCNKLPGILSGGEQQRVAIARAVTADPAVILADEPTGSLDSANGAEILRLLRRLADERKQTIVLVTHDLSVAQASDRVVLLRDGRIVGGVSATELSPESFRAILASEPTPSSVPAK